MIKLLAETKGSFQLLDLGHHGQSIKARRPSVVVNSNFVQDRIGRNQVRVIAELKDEATDEEFASYLRESDGDIALAVDSFISEFGKEAVEKKKKGRGRKNGQPKQESETPEISETPEVPGTEDE